MLYKLLTLVTNGDKIVLEKLNSCVTSSTEDSDDDDFAIRVDHKFLVDEDPRNLTLVKDLLNLPRKLTSNIMTPPAITTFVERRWNRTKPMFVLSFVLYLIFLVLYSTFLGMMYTRNNDDNLIRIPVQLPQTCDALIPQARTLSASDEPEMMKRAGLSEDDQAIDVSLGVLLPDGISSRGVKNKNKAKGRNKNKKDDGDYEIKLEVIKEKKNKTRVTRAKNKERLFSGCSARRRWSDLSLCTVEALLLVSIIILLTVEAWQVLALGKDYFLELENWFELLVLGLASCTMGLKAELDILAIVASVGICLAWIELIFLFGRYPSLGGSFSIMYYSITKRVVKTALGLILLVFAFAFAFFIIHFDNSNESFEDVPKSLVKSFVMVLGEFEFNDLWESSESASSGLSQVFTMMLLVGLIMFGTIIMINLIVAIIITDIAWLQKVSKQQVLRNQVNITTISANIAHNIYVCPGSSRCTDSRSSVHVQMFVDQSRGHGEIVVKVNILDDIAIFPHIDFFNSRQLEVWVCVHSVCKCGRMRPASDTRERLLEIINNDSGSGKY